MSYIYIMYHKNQANQKVHFLVFHYNRGDCLTSILCVTVWHEKTNFFVYGYLSNFFLQCFCIPLPDIKKHVGQAIRLILGLKDFFQISSMSHHDVFFKSVNKCKEKGLWYIKTNPLLYRNKNTTYFMHKVFQTPYFWWWYVTPWQSWRLVVTPALPIEISWLFLNIKMKIFGKI